MSNLFHIIASIPKALQALTDLAARILALHEDPDFKDLIASNANVKAQSDAISADARAIQDALK